MRRIFTFLVLGLLISACEQKVQTPADVADEFWQAAQLGQMDRAKQFVSWDTTGYLKYFKDDKFKIKRIEFGESEATESVVTIDTVIILQREDSSDVRLPSKTVLIKTEGVWRVQLKQTMAAVINETMNAAANQFNQLLREGMSELNKALAGSVDEISDTLEQGAKELGETLEENAKEFGDSLNQLQQELERKLPKSPESAPPSRQEI